MLARKGVEEWARLIYRSSLRENRQLKTLSEKNEELYIQNKKLLSILESSSYTIRNE